MATLMYTSLCMMIVVTCIYGSPIKRSAADQQATDCYGTECYYDPDYFESDTTINVNFPENLTQVVLMMSQTLTQIADTQTQMSSTLTQMASTQTQLANSFNQVVHLLEKQDQQQQNLTAAMNSVVSVLKNQQETLEDINNSLPPWDCTDLATKGYYPTGLYTFDLWDGLISYSLYCDMETDFGGWTVFQKRFDGSLDFFLGWEQYEEGFGNPDGEYWMGLRDIHRLTRNHAWALRIDMEAFDGDTAYAMYDSFSVGNASSKYQLHIGAYHGKAGDSLTPHNGMAFTTKDRDNDARSGSNCAQSFKGAWWYNSCHHSNLNALYLGATGSSDTGNVWSQWKGFYQSLKRTEMKMRRVG